FRARNLAALNRVDDALALCDSALLQLKLNRDQYQALAGLLDEPQIARLEKAVSDQEAQINTLRSTLDTRLADALDKSDLQKEVAQLQQELNQLKSQAGSISESES